MDRAQLVRCVRRRRGEAEVRIDLVQEAEVDLGLRRGGDGREQGSRGVRGAHVESFQTTGRTRQGVRRIGAHLEATGHTQAGRGAHLGHLHDVKDTGGIQTTLDIIHAQVRTLTSLEGDLDIGRDLEGGFQDTRTITLQLSFIEAELVERILGSNFGRQGTGFILFRFNGKRHGSGILFGLEDKLGREVVRQEIC